MPAALDNNAPWALCIEHKKEQEINSPRVMQLVHLHYFD